MFSPLGERQSTPYPSTRPRSTPSTGPHFRRVLSPVPSSPGHPLHPFQRSPRPVLVCSVGGGCGHSFVAVGFFWHNLGDGEPNNRRRLRPKGCHDGAPFNPPERAQYPPAIWQPPNLPSSPFSLPKRKRTRSTPPPHGTHKRPQTARSTPPPTLTKGARKTAKRGPCGASRPS